MRLSYRCGVVLWYLTGSTFPLPVGAQEAIDDRARALATATAALEAISNENMIAFTDLMLEEAVMFRVADTGRRERYSYRTRSESRASKPDVDIVERGFNPEISISGPLATVWLPYDLYVDGEWSHCGVDVFTLARVEDQWKIAFLGWSIEQPPDCRRHPDGPPDRGNERADTSVALRVTGEVTNPLSLSAADIAAFPHREVQAEIHGRTLTYRGVALNSLLEQAGVPEGREVVRTVVVARASDGYEAVFSLAELTADFVDRLVIVADMRDGESLPDDEGPVRLVSPSENEAARWVRQLYEIEVRRLR